MNSFFVKMWFGAVLSLLSTILPTWLTRETPVVHHPHHAIVVAKTVPTPVLRRDKLVEPKIALSVPVNPSILCELDGQTIYQGLPYGNADIDFWITTPAGQEMRHVKTNADGTYHLSLTVPAQVNEPLDWEMKAQTSDLKTLHRAGRRIVRYNDSNVTIRNVLEFVSAD